MKLTIDIEKSIEQERILPKSMFSYYYEYIMYDFTALAFLTLIIMDMYKENNFDLTLARTFEILIIITTLSLTLYILDKMRKLTILNVKDKTKAKQYVLTLIKMNNWEICKQRDEIIIIQVNSSFRNKRQVTFIFRNEIIYINVMSFGRNIMSPIYYSADKKVLNSIIDKLKVNKIVQNDFS